MTAALLPLIFVFLIAVAITFAILARRAQNRRREALAALAQSLGWSFDPERISPKDSDDFGGFAFFRRGHSQKAYNTLRGDFKIGERVFPAVMGDFLYLVTSSNGKTTTTTTHRFSYLILRLAFGGAGVPDLVIRREGLLDKVAGALGFDDIDFESAEFSRKFYVKCRDKRFAYDVITARMMEFLLGEFGPGVEIEGGWMLLSEGSGCWTPERFRGMLAWAEKFLGMWPEHVTAGLDSGERVKKR